MYALIGISNQMPEDGAFDIEGETATGSSFRWTNDAIDLLRRVEDAVASRRRRIAAF